MNPFHTALAAFVLVTPVCAQARFGLEDREGLREVLAGRRVGLICNHTSVDREGTHLIDLLHADEAIELRALFGPEHGYRGDRDAAIESGKDERTGLPVFSLYGETRKPTAEMLAGLDTLVFDIQDVGARFYTYISTLSNAMEAAAEHGLRFVVLDRPNPIGGVAVEGPVLEPERRSFVGCQPIPVRHGMTVGELARLFAGEGWIAGGAELDLRVVAVRGWTREELWDRIGRPFVRTSPNMPDLETALVYPGLCLLEGTNLNEGRGTERPFLRFGAPWLDAERLRAELGEIPGLELKVCTYTPVSIPNRADKPRFQDQECRGLALHVTGAESFEPVAFGLKLIAAARRLHPDEFTIAADRLTRLLGSASAVRVLERGAVPPTEQGVPEFLARRAKYLLYPVAPVGTGR